MGSWEELKSIEGLQAAFSTHGPRLVVVVLAALIAIQAGFLVTGQNRAAGADADRSAMVATASTWASPTGRGRVQVSDIIAAHLFGASRSTAADADAPQTSVQLVLAGVLAVPDPKRGLAIIGPSSAAAKLYTVGSAVPGGVNLYAVYPDRVLLDRGGAIESLLLPNKFAAGTSAPTVTSTALSPAQRLAALAQGNGALLGGLVRATAVMNGAKLTGYRIFPGGRASVSSFTQLGLRPGDLITAVNGTTLDDPSRGNEILQTLSSASTATLTVLRNGQSMDLNLNLETVVNDAENAASQAAAAARRGGAFGGPMGGGGRFPGLGGAVNAPGVSDDGSAAPPAPPENPPERPSDQ